VAGRQRLFDVSVKKIKKKKRQAAQTEGLGAGGKKQAGRGKETVGEEREDMGEKSEVINALLI
jgi:hypothetical protein